MVILLVDALVFRRIAVRFASILHLEPSSARPRQHLRQLGEQVSILSGLQLELVLYSASAFSWSPARSHHHTSSRDKPAFLGCLLDSLLELLGRILVQSNVIFSTAWIIYLMMLLCGAIVFAPSSAQSYLRPLLDALFYIPHLEPSASPPASALPLSPPLPSYASLTGFAT